MADSPQFTRLIVLPSRWKLIKLGLAGTLMTAASLTVWWVSIAVSFNWILFLLGSFSTLFFGLCLLIVLLRIFYQAPGIVIDREGIYDNTASFGEIFIRWEEIRGFRTLEMENQQFLTILFHNPKQFMADKQGFKRFMMNLNLRFYESPIHISSSMLKCNFTEFCALITAAHSAATEAGKKRNTHVSTVE